jgi:hypothetical protein
MPRYVVCKTKPIFEHLSDGKPLYDKILQHTPPPAARKNEANFTACSPRNAVRQDPARTLGYAPLQKKSQKNVISA